MELYRENFRNLPVPNHKAYGYQILHVALSSGPSPRGVNYNPRVELIAKGYKFYIGLYSEILRNFLVAKNKTMATNFSPCKGSYVLNQFPSNVMFAMNGFMYQPVERYRAIMALLFDNCPAQVMISNKGTSTTLFQVLFKLFSFCCILSKTILGHVFSYLFVLI